MIDIKISHQLSEVCPGTRLGLIQSDIKYQKNNQFLWNEIEKNSLIKFNLLLI